MRILRLTIQGFGNLRGEFIFSTDRCNVILEPNESGKSTMAAAILAGLYGLPRQRATRDRPIKMKDRFRPWAGGSFALEMDLEAGGRLLTIARDFHADTTVVRDGRSGRDITAEFSQGRDAVDVGEALCGLSRDDFARCCFVGQHDLDGVKDAGGLTHALQRIASSQQGDVAAGEALEVLARAADRDYRGELLGKGKVDTEIDRLQEQIRMLQAEMDAIQARRLASEDRIRRLEELTRQEARAEQELAELDRLHVHAAHQETRGALERAERDAADRDAKAAQRDALAPFASFPAAGLGRLREIKGTLASLARRRAVAEARAAQLEAPLARAAEGASGMAAASPASGILTLLEGRRAVLEDLWTQRREKRATLRREQKRQRAEGNDPRRAETLAATFAALTEEDRRFLHSYRERTFEVKAALAENTSRRDRMSRDEQGQRLLVPLAAHKGKERLALMTLSAGIILSALLPFTLDNKLPVIGTVLMAFVGLLWWLMLLEKRPVPGAEQFGTELQRIETEVWTHEKEVATLQGRLARIALSLGYARTETAVEDHRELERLKEALLPMTTLAAGLRDACERYAKAAQEVGRIMAEAGEPAPDKLTPRRVRRFRDRLAAATAAGAEAERLQSDLADARHEIAETGVEIAKLQEEIRLLVEEAFGSAPDEIDLDSVLARFEDGAARRDQLEHLRAEIEALESRHPVPLQQRVERLRAETEMLARRAADVSAATAGQQSTGSDRSAHAYAEERRRVQEEARRIQTERQALAEELGDLLRSLRGEYPEREALLEERTAALDQAVAFRDAVAIATDVLSRQARQAYAEWADHINETAGAVLTRLNPRYGDLRFDTDLTFTVRHLQSGQRLDQRALDAHASAGARDQIYLAVRLAVSEYLSSSGVPLPFILDDPFASFDDERFARAMEFLIEEVGRNHQLIVLSCHETRHRAWRQSSRLPLADRMRIVDLTPLSA
jgi:DNA repair exonuclease SbcCD ATPase subunit